MDGRFTVKELDSKDLKAALDLVWNVFLEFEAPDYSEEGVLEFKSFIEFDSISEKISRNQFRMWTCFEGGILVGVLAVRPPCHISLLFVDKQYHRKGIARAMVGHMMECYKSAGGHSEITVNSSPYAKEAYHKMGFADVGAEQTANGIRFIPMKHVMK